MATRDGAGKRGEHPLFRENLSDLKGHDGQGQPYFRDACVDSICVVGEPCEKAQLAVFVTLKRAQRAASREYAQPALIGGREPEQ
jgi:hypothetical protein